MKTKEFECKIVFFSIYFFIICLNRWSWWENSLKCKSKQILRLHRWKVCYFAFIFYIFIVFMFLFCIYIYFWRKKIQFLFNGHSTGTSMHWYILRIAMIFSSSHRMNKNKKNPKWDDNKNSKRNKIKISTYVVLPQTLWVQTQPVHFKINCLAQTIVSL